MPIYRIRFVSANMKYNIIVLLPAEGKKSLEKASAHIADAGRRYLSVNCPSLGQINALLEVRAPRVR